jgi:hypothetical protein
MESPTPNLLTLAAELGARLKAEPSKASTRAAGFRLLLADLFPGEAELERYREAQATAFEDLCVECKVYPARLQCRCMTCLARRGAA